MVTGHFPCEGAIRRARPAARPGRGCSVGSGNGFVRQGPRDIADDGHVSPAAFGVAGARKARRRVTAGATDGASILPCGHKMVRTTDAGTTHHPMHEYFASLPRGCAVARQRVRVLASAGSWQAEIARERAPAVNVAPHGRIGFPPYGHQEIRAGSSRRTARPGCGIDRASPASRARPSGRRRPRGAPRPAGVIDGALALADQADHAHAAAAAWLHLQGHHTCWVPCRPLHSHPRRGGRRPAQMRERDWRRKHTAREHVNPRPLAQRESALVWSLLPRAWSAPRRVARQPPRELRAQHGQRQERPAHSA